MEGMIHSNDHWLMSYCRDKWLMSDCRVGKGCFQRKDGNKKNLYHSFLMVALSLTMKENIDDDSITDRDSQFCYI